MPTSFDYLLTQAVSRIYLDNVDHIQSSWVTQGMKIGQVALEFGADDLGSIMIEENVVSAAGTTYRASTDDFVRTIRALGKIAGAARHALPRRPRLELAWSTRRGSSRGTGAHAGHRRLVRGQRPRRGVGDERGLRRRVRLRGRRDAAFPQRRLHDLPCSSRVGRAACTTRESNQEDFLVLAGECLLLVEGEERPLRAWDFVHCPPGTEHIFVGAGDGPVRDLHGRRAKRGQDDRLPAIGARAPSRRRRRDGDPCPARGIRVVPALASGPARDVGRPALGRARLGLSEPVARRTPRSP